MTDNLEKPQKSKMRAIGIALVIFIGIACLVSAYFAMKAGYPARAASVFFAGAVFEVIFMSRLRRRK